jgi:hypothetical protein
MSKNLTLNFNVLPSSYSSYYTEFDNSYYTEFDNSLMIYYNNIIHSQITIGVTYSIFVQLFYNFPNNTSIIVFKNIVFENKSKESVADLIGFIEDQANFLYHKKSINSIVDSSKDVEKIRLVYLGLDDLSALLPENHIIIDYKELIIG